MLVRYGGEPAKRGGLFGCNFLQSHKSYKKNRRAKPRKPFPSNIRRKRNQIREAYLVRLKISKQRIKPVEIPFRTLEDFSPELTEFIIEGCFETYFNKLNNLTLSDLVDYFNRLWGFKVVTRQVAKIKGHLLAGVRFFLYGIPEPFFVTAREIKFLLRQAYNVA